MAARRPNLIKTKPKKIRVSRTEQYLVNKKYLGEEPVLKPNYSQTEYIRALTWYNSMLSTSDAREYLQDYLKDNKRMNDLKKIKKLPDNKLSLTACWVARMLSRHQLDDNSVQFFENKIREMTEYKVEETVEETPKNVVSIQDRMKEKALDIIGEIEYLIDTEEQFSMYEWLQKNQIPRGYISKIIDHYSPWLDELIQAYEGKDADLKEAYRSYTKKKLVARIEFFSNLIQDLERYQDNQKKTKAIRKPKPVPVEKKIRGLKYQKESNELKLVSVNPEKIIGAQELWAYNTKYKVLTVFRALDRGGLQVKGTSIIGFSEETSMSRSVGRKPEQVLQRVLTGGKIVLKKIMDELKTEKKLQHRINENTILLKIS